MRNGADWLKLREGDIIRGENKQEGFSFLLKVEDVTSFPDSTEISSKNFITMSLSDKTLNGTFFTVIDKVSLPENYAELTSVPLDDIEGRDDVFIISSKSEWVRTKEFAKGEEHFYMDYKGKQQAGFFI